MIGTAARAALAPYTLYLKLGLLAVMFFGGTFVGCTYKENKMQDEIVQLANEKKYYAQQSKKFADALVEVNKQYKANAQAAKEQAERAKVAEKEAEKLRKENAKEEENWQKQFERARRTPDCATLLEMQLCPAVRNY